MLTFPIGPPEGGLWPFVGAPLPHHSVDGKQDNVDSTQRRRKTR